MSFHFPDPMQGRTHVITGELNKKVLAKNAPPSPYLTGIIPGNLHHSNVPFDAVSFRDREPLEDNSPSWSGDYVITYTRVHEGVVTGVSWLTLSWQVKKAMSLNLVDSLKSE